MKFRNFLTTISVFLTLFSANSFPQTCRLRAEVVAKGLSPGNALLEAVKSGEVGDGIVRPWMKSLAENGVRQVWAEISFDTRDSKIRYEIRRISFYGDYYGYQKKVVLAPDDERRLVDQVQLALLAEAISELMGIRSHWGHTGTLYPILLDDPCLPTPGVMPTVDQLETVSEPLQRESQLLFKRH